MVLAVLGLPELIYQGLYGFWRRPDKAETPQMAHLLPVGVVETARQRKRLSLMVILESIAYSVR